MGELCEDDFRRLRELGARLACRDGSFRRWLWKLARDAAVSHLREHPEYLGAAGEGAPRWREHGSLPEALPDEAPPVSWQANVGHIARSAPEVLEPPQLDALTRSLQGEDCAEIAAALQLRGGAEAARRLLQSAKKRLRSHFGTEPLPPVAVRATARRRGRGRATSPKEPSRPRRAGTSKID
jgi:hypothetical protein